MILTHTCLPAPAELIVFGYTVVVADEASRTPVAAFVSGEQATAYCAKLNKTHEVAVNLSSKAEATPPKAPETPKVISAGVVQTLGATGRAEVK